MHSSSKSFLNFQLPHTHTHTVLQYCYFILESIFVDVYTNSFYLNIKKKYKQTNKQKRLFYLFSKLLFLLKSERDAPQFIHKHATRFSLFLTVLNHESSAFGGDCFHDLARMRNQLQRKYSQDCKVLSTNKYKFIRITISFALPVSIESRIFIISFPSQTQVDKKRLSVFRSKNKFSCILILI